MRYPVNKTERNSFRPFLIQFSYNKRVQVSHSYWYITTWSCPCASRGLKDFSSRYCIFKVTGFFVMHRLHCAWSDTLCFTASTFLLSCSLQSQDSVTGTNTSGNALYLSLCVPASPILWRLSSYNARFYFIWHLQTLFLWLLLLSRRNIPHHKKDSSHGPQSWRAPWWNIFLIAHPLHSG